MLMHYMNNNNELLVTTLEYSTPSLYMKEIEREYLRYQD